MRGLDPARAAIVRVSAAVAARDEARLTEALLDAAGAAPGLAVDEALLQSHLFVGFPIALEALARWREVCGMPPPDPAAESPGVWSERGASVCRTVYGRNYEKLRSNVAAIHPDLDLWMVQTGYGRVIGRPSLDLAARELCIAALLVVWDAPRQLHSHLRGALNAGATSGELAEAVAIASEFATADAAARASDLLQRIIG